MRIFVISLRDSVSRRAQVTEQLDRIRVRFEFFDALDGEQGRSEFESIDERQFEISTGRNLLAPEVGCFASHRWLWQRCVTLNEPILIMEDDALLADHFMQALQFTSRVLPDAGYVRLQTESRGTRTLIGFAHGLSLHLFRKPPQGAMCYAITPAVAKALLASSHNLTAPVDKFLAQTWVHRQPMYGIYPYCVSEAETAHRSTIGERCKTQKSPSIKLIRLRYRLDCWAQRTRFNWQVAKSATTISPDANVPILSEQ